MAGIYDYMLAPIENPLENIGVAVVIGSLPDVTV
jgi:hypothetical protein